MVSGVMNSVELFVITTLTVAPESCSRRMSSADLYAAILPLIPNNTFLLDKFDIFPQEKSYAAKDSIIPFYNPKNA